jgi:hypothetical protein
MKATNFPTNFPMRDGPGLLPVLAQLCYSAMVPSTREAWEGPVTRQPGWLERIENWAAKARQRDRERFLAESQDVFELERRLRVLERRPYY